MRFLFFTLILLLSHAAWSFQYQIETGPLLNPSRLQAYELKKHFEKFGYHSLSDQNLSAGGLPFDSLLISNHWEKSLMIKAGLKVPSSFEGQIIEDDSSGVSAFHFRFEGTPYLIVALHHKKSELQRLFQPWLKTSQSVLWRLLVPEAQALYCPPMNKTTAGLQSTAKHIESNEILKTIGSCGMDALQGMKQSVTGTFDFFKTLATNPKKLWTEMKESFVQLKEFALNLNQELKQVFAAFSSMSSEQKVQLACTMTGELIAGAAQAFIAGGALAKLLPSLILKMKSASASFLRIADLEKSGMKLPDKSFLTKEVLSCAR